MVAFALLAMMITIQAFNYESVKSFENPPEWSTMMSEKCGIKSLVGAYQARSLTDFGDIASIFGAFIGLILMQKVAPGAISGSLSEDSIFKKVARLCVAGILMIPWVGMRYGVSKLSIQNSYFQLLFRSTIPQLMVGFSFFLIADLVNLKLGLIKMVKAKSDNDNVELGDHQAAQDDTENLLKRDTKEQDDETIPE